MQLVLWPVGSRRNLFLIQDRPKNIKGRAIELGEIKNVTGKSQFKSVIRRK